MFWASFPFPTRWYVLGPRYVEELRQYRVYLQRETVVADLAGLNLLGVQVIFFCLGSVGRGALQLQPERN